jgi:hypothetical protein
VSSLLHLTLSSWNSSDLPCTARLTLRGQSQARPTAAVDVKSPCHQLTSVLAKEKRKLVKSPGLYKGMSRTFFSLRRKRGFCSRHPAPCHHGRR